MKEIFPKIKGKVIFNEPLSRHTTFRIGGPCEVWVEPEGMEDLIKIIKYASTEKRKVLIIGNGSNILARDGVFKGIVVRLSGKKFCQINIKGTTITAGAGAQLGKVVGVSCKKGLKGIEGLAGIPGTLGGALYMNAGYVSKISDIIKSVKVIHRKNLKIKVLTRKDIKFGYRQSNLNMFIILELKLALKKEKPSLLLEKKEKLLELRRNEQPVEKPSAGCVFKNPAGKIRAAQYIDMLGLKGKRSGGVQVSKKHANFIVSKNGAKASDVLKLITLIKKNVKKRFKKDLVTEIKII